MSAADARCGRCECQAFVGGEPAAFCADCGHARSDHGRTYCGSCAAPVAAGTRFCVSCGAPVARDARAPVPNSGVEQRAAEVGAAVGHATRAAVSVAAAPVAAAVWTSRPSIPTWQKVIGVIAWPLMVLTPHGLVFLGGSFLVMVVLGRHNPYSWAAWVTKWASIFLLVTLVVAVIAVIAFAASHKSSDAISQIHTAASLATSTTRARNHA